MLSCVNLPSIKGDSSNNSPLSLSDIRIRDPNILYWNGTYYLTGTTVEDGFLGYSSTDLVNWQAHDHIYTKNDSNYWAQRLFWAAEITEFNGKFYLFFTAYADGYKRGTGVAVADNPMGPYVDLMADPLTPPEFDCLDGHLFKHPNGSLYFYYVFEWLNNGVGEMWVQEISPDFTHLLGDPVILFIGRDARWSNNVIDGPSMIYKNGQYFLFWSSFNKYNDGKYCVGYATGSSPFGPFVQSHNPIIWEDGGHSTWFVEKATQQLKIVYHQPNSKEECAIIKNLNYDQDLNEWVVDPAENIPFIWQDYLIPVLIITGGIIIYGVFILIFIKQQKKSEPIR